MPSAEHFYYNAVTALMCITYYTRVLVFYEHLSLFRYLGTYSYSPADQRKHAAFGGGDSEELSYGLLATVLGSDIFLD